MAEPTVDELIAQDKGATVAPAAPGSAPMGGPSVDDLIKQADSNPETGQPNYKGFWSGMVDKLHQRGENIYDLTHIPSEKDRLIPASKVMRTVGQEAGAVNDFIGETVKRLYHWLPDASQQRIKTAAMRIAFDNNGHPSTLIKAIQGSKEAYDRLAKAYPSESANLEAVLNIFSVMGGGKVAKATEEAVEGVAKPLVKEGANIARDVSEIAARSLSKDSEKTINNTIKETMSRAVKMSSKNKGDWNAISGSFFKANNAVKAIVDNQGILSYTDYAGNVIGQGLPKSMDEFAQAISQTKQHIFAQYDALATDAEKAGMKVDLQPTVKKLEEIAQDPSILRQRPDVAKYAETRATDLLIGESSLTPSEAQREISILNEKLKPYYANPSVDGAHKIWVDEMIARDMRANLDHAITSATGEKYQGLKNLYGSLTAIEPEVSHRAVIFGRQNIKGMPDYIGTPISTVMAIKGIMTGNPIELAAAGATIAAKNLMKRANNSDRLIAAMFGKIAKQMKRQGPFEPESKTFAAMTARSGMTEAEQGFKRSTGIGGNPLFHDDWIAGLKPSKTAETVGKRVATQDAESEAKQQAALKKLSEQTFERTPAKHAGKYLANDGKMKPWEELTDKERNEYLGMRSHKP